MSQSRQGTAANSPARPEARLRAEGVSAGLAEQTNHSSRRRLARSKAERH
jgi:hypothetical protein